MSINKIVPAKKKLFYVKKYFAGKTSARKIADKLGVGVSTVYWWLEQYRGNQEEAFHDGKSKNKEYALELKKQAVADYLSGKGSQAEICKKYGILSKHTLRDWIMMYNSKGEIISNGGSKIKMSRETTIEERIKIVKEHTEFGKKYSEIALEYNVNYQQVRSWVMRYEEMGISGLEDRRGQRKINQVPRNELERIQIENEKLKQKLYLSEMENEILKKLDQIERRNVSHNSEE